MNLKELLKPTVGKAILAFVVMVLSFGLIVLLSFIKSGSGSCELNDLACNMSGIIFTLFFWPYLFIPKILGGNENNMNAIFILISWAINLFWFYILVSMAQYSINRTRSSKKSQNS